MQPDGILGASRRMAGVFALTGLLVSAPLLPGCTSPSVAPTVPVSSKPASSKAATSTTSTASVSASPSVDASASKTCECAVGTTLTVTGSGKKANVAGRPSDSSAISAAAKWLAEEEEAVLTNVKVDSMTRDGKGTWWVLLSATEESAGPVRAVMMWNGKRWEDRAYGLTLTDMDLPKDVRF